MIRRHRYNRTGVLILLLLSGGFGCTSAPTPLDLASSDPSQDQLKIAGYHRREAALFRLKADELSQRAMVYERLFGRESEWVSGARFLVQFYEEAAQEQERLAGWHRSIVDHGRSDPR